MKAKTIKIVAGFVPLSLIILILVSTLTNFNAEMYVIGTSSTQRPDETNQPNNLNTETESSGTTYFYTLPNTSPSVNPNANTNPLTGLSTATDISRNRPVAVSVSNQRTALPTNAINGISHADIIYEVLLEGGGTRFVALYQDISNAGFIGSIRSVRHYTVELAEAYNAILIHAGGSPLGYEEIEHRGITNLDEISGRHPQLFARDVNRIPGHTVLGYHSAITHGAVIAHQLPTLGFRTTHDPYFRQALSFTNNPIPMGNMAHRATVRFSAAKDSIFTYNEAQNLYFMSQYGSQFTDVNNGAPVAFTNLLILEMPIADLVGHGAGSGRQDMSTVGGGSGYFVNGGSYVRINWFRADKSSQFIYTFEDGTIVELGRGRTYVGIVPNLMNTSIS